MKSYFTLLSLVILFVFSALADTVPLRRMKLDSMDQSIKRQMKRLDSTMNRLDVIMDSITGKPKNNLDTLAFLEILRENHKRELRQKEMMLWIKGGALTVIIFLAVIGWRWKVNKR